MPFGKIVEDADRVSFIEEQFGADAADVTCAPDDENFHRASCGALPRRVKANRIAVPKWNLGTRGARPAISGPRWRAPLTSSVRARRSSAESGGSFPEVSEL